MIKEKLSITPNKPGCYLMMNKSGKIIYVGKAKNLKKRLSSYFRGKHTGKTAKLVNEIADFDYIVVSSETEALILELNLIKKHNPKYNILLRDDKSYPYIELTNEPVPRLMIVRNINRKKTNLNRMYGPYPNVQAARKTVDLLNRIYPLRKCRTYPKRPCLYYHINQCLGYCVYDIDKKVIKDMEREIISFLKGDSSFITDKIKKEMMVESEKMNYEKAQELKELLDYINITLAKQKVEINDLTPYDVFGFYKEKDYLAVQTFFIRGGKIVETTHNIIEEVDETNEELTRYIAKFYDKNVLLPKVLLVPEIVDANLLETFLKIKVNISKRGVKRKIVEMANNNAKILLEKEFELIKKEEKRTVLVNERLKELLKLDKLERIEVFDNSHLFGSYYVAGMVVFINGKPSKNDYRKYKININKNDDYEAMREVIYRRYFRVLKDNLEKPDLIIVDGGAGQVNSALEVLQSLNLNIPVIGLKKDDKHKTSKLIKSNPIEEIVVEQHSDLFNYLERIQEEVHRFTINYHRQLRSKGSLESILDKIEGIGPKRKTELLKKYKTIAKLKELTVEELQEILPMNVAINLFEALKNYDVT
ncbi:MAG: excinuclease ABC subunit UvrC [Mollicutes bacterium]|nr:excinuclease ABC subunit UvrC [Mollicutes bacterium]